MKKISEKISFQKIQDVLSREEMKVIMAGSNEGGNDCDCWLTAADIVACHDYCWPQYESEDPNNPLYNHCMFCCKAGKCGCSCA